MLNLFERINTKMKNCLTKHNAGYNVDQMSRIVKFYRNSKKSDSCKAGLVRKGFTGEVEFGP